MPTTVLRAAGSALQLLCNGCPFCPTPSPTRTSIGLCTSLPLIFPLQSQESLALGVCCMGPSRDRWLWRDHLHQRSLG